MHIHFNSQYIIDAIRYIYTTLTTKVFELVQCQRVYDIDFQTLYLNVSLPSGTAVGMYAQGSRDLDRVSAQAPKRRRRRRKVIRITSYSWSINN